MPLIWRLKNFLFNRAIGKYRETNLSHVSDDHFSAIQSIAIIFEATDATDREVVLAFANELNETGFDVWPLGFINSKVDGITFRFDFIDLNQLSFAWIPKGEHITKFISKPFDVLINLDTSMHKPLNYIAAASKALFKIGPAQGDHNHYDLMVEMHEKDVGLYIHQIRSTFNKIQG